MTTNTPDRFPVSIRIYSTGREVARIWVDFGSEWIAQAERMALRMADEWGRETDILAGDVWPSGKVGTFERVGIRCLPA